MGRRGKLRRIWNRESISMKNKKERRIRVG
jgi:hypothetical protein